MRAVVCENGALDVAELPAPRPGHGQVLLDVLRCGICGSDLHARRYADQQADALAEAGYAGAMRSNQRVVFGHEFSGTVAEYGPGCRRRVPVGAPVVALPLLRTAAGLDAIGISASAPGGYAEQVVVEESLMLAIPDGLDPELAALTEPMAIGLHAVRRSEIARKDVAVVIGCGPVGLAVVAMLKQRGVRTVVASDLSPGRRRLAQAMGADHVVDPAVGSPYEAAGERGSLATVSAAAELGVSTMERLRRLPVPWQAFWRLGELLGLTPNRPVVFECVGVPGMIDGIVASAPLYSRVVVAGVCMLPDTFRPVLAVNKEIELRFVVGYTPLEFHDTLRMLAAEKLRPAPMVTGVVGLDGVRASFEALVDPEAHAKILIDPRQLSGRPR